MKFLQLLLLASIVFSFCNCSDDENKPLPVQAGKWAGVRVIQVTDSVGVLVKDDTFEIKIELKTDKTGSVIYSANTERNITEWSVSEENEEVIWTEETVLSTGQVNEIRQSFDIYLNEPNQQEWIEFSLQKNTVTGGNLDRKEAWFLSREE